MLKIITLLVAFLVVSPIAVVAGEEWSQFRGPNGTGVSETKNLDMGQEMQSEEQIYGEGPASSDTYSEN